MSKKKSSIGCLFWIALILLVLVVFLFSRKRIENVLQSTGFMDVITREAPIDENAPDENAPLEPRSAESVEVEQDTTPASEQAVDSVPEETNEEIPVIIIEPVEGETIDTEEQADQSEKRFRKSRLYFVGTDDGGPISLQGIIRPVYYTDSPLTETIKSLLDGLSPSELNQDLITLIPEGTTLLGVAVRDGVAYIDFNESFRFNTFGKEGYLAQLKQVVYTSTEFGTVNSVQILIDGKRYTYLGPEGVFIGDPLSRDAFN